MVLINGDELREEYIGSNLDTLMFSIGNTLIFGSFEQDRIPDNGKEPLEWIVLDRTEDAILIATKYAIECKDYARPRKETTWEKSEIREWLNTVFYSSAFSKIESDAILETKIKNRKFEGKYDTDPGLDTIDKVFLLSYGEVMKYFTSDEERKLNTTVHAQMNGAQSPQCFWMTRSPGRHKDEIMAVKNNGQTDYCTPVDDHHLGIRPAIWIDIHAPSTKKAALKEGSVVSFGHYGDNPNEMFESLKWQIIERNETSVLLLAEKSVDNLQFHNERINNISWKNSKLREWLNMDFINLTFSKTEKDSLMPMYVRLMNQDGIDGYYEMESSTALDKVTLLSYKQVKDLFPDRDQRRLKSTEHAKKNGAGGNFTEYWLLSNGRDNISMAVINQNGDPDSRWVTDRRGVRPIIMVSLLFGLEDNGKMSHLFN